MCGPAAFFGAAALFQGAAQYRAGQFEKAQANVNAKLAEQDARLAQQRGAIEEEAVRARTQSILGTQRATFGANNVVTSSGSPLQILSDTAQFGELDALTTRHNALTEAWGLRQEAASSRARGRMAGRLGTMAAASTVLTGGADAFGYWRNNPPRPKGRRIDASARPLDTRGYA